MAYEKNPIEKLNVTIKSVTEEGNRVSIKTEAGGTYSFFKTKKDGTTSKAQQTRVQFDIQSGVSCAIAYTETPNPNGKYPFKNIMWFEAPGDIIEQTVDTEHEPVPATAVSAPAKEEPVDETGKRISRQGIVQALMQCLDSSMAFTEEGYNKVVEWYPRYLHLSEKGMPLTKTDLNMARTKLAMNEQKELSAAERVAVETMEADEDELDVEDIPFA